MVMFKSSHNDIKGYMSSFLILIESGCPLYMNMKVNVGYFLKEVRVVS